MDSKLSTILFAGMIFLAGAFFVSRGLLHKPPPVPEVVAPLSPTTPTASSPSSGEPLSLTQDVKDYIAAHCNSQGTVDATLNAKIDELENKLTEVQQTAVAIKEIHAKIEAFRADMAKMVSTRAEKVKEGRKNEVREIQTALMDGCKPGPGAGKKRGSINSTPDSGDDFKD